MLELPKGEIVQFDIDMRGEYQELFKALRELILSYLQISELKNAKQTSYSDEFGAVVMLRGSKNGFILSFGRGAKLASKFPQLSGNGKVVRQLIAKDINSLNLKLVKELLEESFILGLEQQALKELANK